MAVRVQCPFCAKTLKMGQAPAPYRLLSCPACGSSFPASAAPAKGAEASPARPEPASVGTAPAPDWARNVPQPTKPLAPPPPAAPPPLPSSILTPVTPPPPSTAALKPPPLPAPAPAPARQESGAPPGGPRRGLLLGAIAGALLLLVGSTALAVALASRTDRRKHPQPVAQKQDPGSVGSQEGQQQFDSQRRDEMPPPHRDDSPPARRDDRPQRDDRPSRGNDFRPPPINDNKQEPVSADRSTLPRELQEEVNRAIDKGVAFLKKTQLLNGTWESNHQVGMAALPGLTLLECGVKADDPAVQKAAKYVREHVMKNTHTATYECSLALLFLDRLGDPKDKPLIRSIAMRLVGGQLPDGGWTYGLPQLSGKEERELMEFLDKTRPERKMDLMVRDKDDRKLDSSIKSDERKSLDGYYEALEGKKPDKGSNVKEFDSEPKRPKPLSQEEAKKAATKLPQQVQRAPAVTEAANAPPPNKGMIGTADNSNTQFAMLALWAARRHDVPLERSLDAVGKRFKDSQSQQGTWGYHVGRFAGGTPAMTGAGLLGLAVGHGSATDPDRKFKVRDPQIDKGLKALGQNVGKPLGKGAIEQKKNNKGRIVLKRQNTPINLYFLWTVERVGVLYGVHELDGKDWYLWGVELLLPVQNDEGSWQQGGYHMATKHLDTSFALLFLKRANLAADLTKRLDFVVEGKPTR